MLPAVSEIPSLSTEERAAILDQLFEPCVQLHTLSVSLLHDKTFLSYDDLITSIGVQLTELSESKSTSDTEWLEKILGAHPRLGEKKVDSEQSRAEQAQLNTGGAGETAQLRDLNQEYENAFSGLRYVIFVNGRSGPVIMDDMKKRIQRGDISMEKADAIRAMCEIAADRARKLSAS